MSAEKRPRKEIMVQDLDVNRQALGVENREAERLRSCLSTVETAIAAANRETATVEAVAGQAQA